MEILRHFTLMINKCFDLHDMCKVQAQRMCYYNRIEANERTKKIRNFVFDSRHLSQKKVLKDKKYLRDLLEMFPVL